MGNDVIKYGVNVREFNEQHWEFVGGLKGDEAKARGYKIALYRCRHCGEVVDRVKHSFKTNIFICQNECVGVIHGRSTIVLKGINDIATTHPHLIKYFVNNEDVYRYSAGSSKKLCLQCPDCGTIKELKLDNLTRRGFSCPICSDGYSYPEKFVGGLLRQLNAEFKKEYTLDNGKTRYDFYLPHYSCIVEVHGIQHYINNTRTNARSLEEEQANDRYKYELAIQNGIERYIVIDARESSLEWMKENILQSQLPSLLNFNENDIDWSSINNNSVASLVKEVCDYFNEHGGSTVSIGNIFNISHKTVSHYLIQGTELKWCEYTGEVKIQNRGDKRIKGTHLATGDEIIFNSGHEAGRWLFENGLTNSKTVQTNISSCCLGQRKSACGYRWEYIG